MTAKYERSLYECWRTQHAWGIWMELIEDTYMFVVDYNLSPKSKQSLGVGRTLLFLTWKFSFLIPFSIIQAHLPPKFRVMLVQLFIWLKYWRFGCESFLHSEFFHLGSLWFLGKLMKSTYIRLVIWLFMTNYKLGWISFNHFFFPEEQKKWNVYDFSFPFLLCSNRFFSFAIDSEPAIELFLCCCLELLSKNWVI